MNKQLTEIEKQTEIEKTKKAIEVLENEIKIHPNEEDKINIDSCISLLKVRLKNFGVESS